jgi:GT2 family glycosyltransferase
MLKLPPGSTRWFEQGPGNAAVKRDACIARFLADPKWQWIYFSDSDHVVEPDTVLRLLAHDLPMVGGLYAGPVRDGSSDGMTVYAGFNERTTTPEHLTGLQRVDWIGGGSMLVRRDVLSKIPAPWFGKADDAEDLDFCHRVRAAGFPIHVDASERVTHLQLVPIVVPQ